MPAGTLNFLMSTTPILVMVVLAVGFRCQAIQLALWGTGYTAVLALWWFQTEPMVVLVAGMDGLLTNLPLLLVIYSGMLLSGVLVETGSMQRVVGWFTSLTRNRLHTTLLISVGSGNFMEGAGVVAEPIIAPMLREVGLPPTCAASLSIAGYSGLMALELGGAILAVLASVTGLDNQMLGRDVALMSLPAIFLMVFSLPWLLGEGKAFLSEFPSLIAVSLLAGGGALFAVLFISDSIAGVLGGLLVLIALSLLGFRRFSLTVQILRDMIPLLFLITCLFSVNLIQPLKRAAIGAWPAVVTVVAGHPIRFQPFFSAYTYLFLSFGLALLLSRGQVSPWRSLYVTTRKALKPISAMALLGAAGQIIAYSGYGQGFTQVDPLRNIPHILGAGMVESSGRLYPLFAPLVGWMGTFLTGYGTASIVLFGKAHVTTAHLLGISPSLLSGAMAVGSAVGSVSSPLKVALAASMSGAVGKEGEILRLCIPLGIGISLLLGIFLEGLTNLP